MGDLRSHWQSRPALREAVATPSSCVERLCLRRQAQRVQGLLCHLRSVTTHFTDQESKAERGAATRQVCQPQQGRSAGPHDRFSSSSAFLTPQQMPAFPFA